MVTRRKKEGVGVPAASAKQAAIPAQEVRTAGDKGAPAIGGPLDSLLKGPDADEPATSAWSSAQGSAPAERTPERPSALGSRVDAAEPASIAHAPRALGEPPTLATSEFQMEPESAPDATSFAFQPAAKPVIELPDAGPMRADSLPPSVPPGARISTAPPEPTKSRTPESTNAPEIVAATGVNKRKRVATVLAAGALIVAGIAAIATYAYRMGRDSVPHPAPAATSQKAPAPAPCSTTVFAPERCGYCGDGIKQEWETPEFCPADFRTCGDGQLDKSVTDGVMVKLTHDDGTYTYVYSTKTYTESCRKGAADYCEADCAKPAAPKAAPKSAGAPAPTAEAPKSVVRSKCPDSPEVRVVKSNILAALDAGSGNISKALGGCTSYSATVTANYADSAFQSWGGSASCGDNKVSLNGIVSPTLAGTTLPGNDLTCYVPVSQNK